MNPLQSSILSQTDFIEMDVTFENSQDYQYLLNVTCFSYVTMKWTVVSRVRMNKMTDQAYGAALKAIIERCKRDSNCTLESTLKGIIVDWQTSQINGIKEAFGAERAEELLRGCRVHFMRAAHRMSEKVCSSAEERNVFNKLASAIMDETDQETVAALFSALDGDQRIGQLPEKVLQKLPSFACSLKNQRWKEAKAWVQWWSRPIHLKMLSSAFTPMNDVQWGTMPSDTNGVESLNKCSIDKSNRSKTLEACVDFTYRLDKKATLEHLYAYSGLPLGFQRKTLANCKLRAARQNKARYNKKGEKDEDAVGLRGKSCTSRKRKPADSDDDFEDANKENKAKKRKVSAPNYFGRKVRVLFDDGKKYTGILVGQDSTTKEWITRFEDGDEDRTKDPATDMDYSFMD